jgi:hypothetical protein
MGKIEVTDIVDEGIGILVVLPSVQQVGQVSDPTEPEGHHGLSCYWHI